MMLRTAFILLICCFVFVVNQTNKNKLDVPLTTTPKSNTVGKKYHLDKVKKKSTKPKPSLCKLARDIGPCRAAKERFYYDSPANECILFTYGGCQANKNNFRSLTKCQKTCKV